jgi:tripartite-type tricarboxylate transporter receptor subunit TctC
MSFFYSGDNSMTTRRTLVHTLLAALISSAFALNTSAQTASSAAATPAWPTQAVKIIVPYAPGGTTDIAARILAVELSKKWNQPVLVDNKPGASTQIGTDQVAKSKDGHTLLMTASPFAVNPTLFAKLPYDTYKDFKPVTLVVRNGLFLVSSGKQPYTSIKDLVEEGKGNKTVSVASPANGSMAHMVAELVADQQKINLLHVPYRGTPPALVDVMAGQVQFMFDNPSSSLPLIKDGKLKALAYTGPKRSKALPNVPTVAETFPGFEAINWFGMLAPSSMDDKLLDRIAKDANDILKRKEVVDRFTSEGVEIGGIPREAFGAFLAVETIRWAKIVRARNIKAD